MMPGIYEYHRWALCNMVQINNCSDNVPESLQRNIEDTENADNIGTAVIKMQIPLNLSGSIPFIDDDLSSLDTNK